MRQGRNGGKLVEGGKKPGAGRPKKLPALDTLIAEVLSDEQNGMSAAEAILKVIRSKAIKGDLKAAEMLLNRAYGKPKEHVDITTKGEQLPTTIIKFVGDSNDGDTDTQEVSTAMESED